MIKNMAIPVILFLLLLNSPLLWANECAKCHMKKNVKQTVFQTDPIQLIADGKPRTITLSDAFDYHGHSCPGVTSTFLAVRYGIKLLFGGDAPDQEDLVIFSRTPSPGTMDMIDFLMINKKGKIKTPAPKGMKSGRDKFFYTIYSKSRAMAVDIQLKPEHYPEDFFKIKKKKANNTISEDERQTLHDYMKDMILAFPSMTMEELFGKPEPYMVITWGNL